TKLLQAKSKRRQPNTFHTDLDKLQPTKATDSIETVGNIWSKQKVYICGLIAWLPKKTLKNVDKGNGNAREKPF
ncbi:hypothetical protein A2U01_0076819, partial [Trifolium medium]|nr:hypothetical protein [Trifolium medium]